MLLKFKNYNKINILDKKICILYIILKYKFYNFKLFSDLIISDLK